MVYMALSASLALVFGRRGGVAADRRRSYTTAALFKSYASLVGKTQQRRETAAAAKSRSATGGGAGVSPRTWQAAAARSARAAALSTTVTSDQKFDADHGFEYDYFVIGAGSGGIASARRAASHGAKVAVAEQSPVLGGTCVNVGCVPKKVLWHAASLADAVHDMEHYGFAGAEDITFDWNYLKQARDAYIRRLNGIYDRNLATSGVARLFGVASLTGPNSVSFTSATDGATKTVTAKHILIATGGKPVVPDGEGIMEHAITSDGFFELDDLPRKAVVVGAGYIAVELAGVLQALGTETKLVLRKEKALRNFDEMVSDTLDDEMRRQGIEIFRNTEGVRKIALDADGLKTVHLNNGETIEGVDTVIVAPGRTPNVVQLNLSNVGVAQKQRATLTSMRCRKRT